MVVQYFGEIENLNMTVNTYFHLSHGHFILSFISPVLFGLRLVKISWGDFRVTVSFMVRVSFLVWERISIYDFVMKFVDKMTSCQFGSWKQVLTVICQKYCNLIGSPSEFVFFQRICGFIRSRLAKPLGG